MLSEDLLQLEKRVDVIKQVCHNTHKKLGGCLLGQGTDVEKRLVRCSPFLQKNDILMLSNNNNVGHILKSLCSYFSPPIVNNMKCAISVLTVGNA